MKRSMGALTVLHPTPVLVIGSYDGSGRANLMTAAWGGICSSAPPSVAVSIREARLTYENIVAAGAFTVNLPPEDYLAEADFVGIYGGRQENKFARTGLTAVRSDVVNAPYVGEFPLVLECRVLHNFDLGAHHQFIGEIVDVKADEAALNEKGCIDPTRLGAFCFSPCDGGYYRIGEYLGQAFSVGRDVG